MRLRQDGVVDYVEHRPSGQVRGFRIELGESKPVCVNWKGSRCTVIARDNASGKH